MFESINHTNQKKADSHKHCNAKFIQPKLTISQPNDEYEQEADATSEHVMRMIDNTVLQQPFFKPSISRIQRKCAHCEEEEKKNAAKRKFLRRKKSR